MKIMRLVLDCFANIYTGIGAHHLDIDFSKQKNVVCVIIGKNGRGKTSILSYMTPFATLGNIDDRDNGSLILPKEKGYKQIILQDDAGTIYDIRHFYQPEKNTHSVKSYIEVNGKEQNENGNVRSFKAIIAELLGIEMDYLRLIRIGDNVSNLISSKSTERKVFMAKLLDEVDIFLKQHKKMSQKSSEVKAIVSHIVDEIAKTGVSDTDKTEKEILEIEHEINRLEKKEEKGKDEKSRFVYDLELIGFPEDGKLKIKELTQRIAKYDRVFTELREGTTSSDISNEIDTVGRHILVAETKVDGLRDKFNDMMKNLNDYSSQEGNLLLEIQKEEEKLNLTSMREHVTNLRKRVNTTYESRFDEIKTNVSKNEFEEFMVFLTDIQSLLNGVYNFGREPIREVLKEMRKNTDIDNLIRSSLLQLEATHRADRLSLIDRLIDKYSGKEYNCDDKGCPYQSLYDELMSIRDTVPVAEVKKDEVFYHSMESVYNALTMIIDMIKEKETLIQKLPTNVQEMFLTDTLFGHIGKLEKIYDQDMLNYWLNFLTDSENYFNLLDEYEKQQHELLELEHASKESYLKKQLKDVREKSVAISERIENIRSDIDDACADIEESKESLARLEMEKEALETYEEARSALLDLKEREQKYATTKIQMLDLDAKLKELSERIAKLSDRHITMQQNLIRYTELQNDLKKYSKSLEIYEHLKYALSNRTGLPLFYINLYLHDTVRIANELLDVVYDGSVYLNEFFIGEDSFRMPYVKNGIEIADVSSASQGEKSFFNMAISSALRAQCMEKYNIALYDEIDGVFDDDNRQKTIPVLEKQLELSKTKQAFLITHNQMFNQYPTDVIDMDNLANSTIPIAWS